MAVLADHVRAVLDRLDNVRAKTAGDGWEALCPAHDDRRRSLGIAVGRDGKVLLCCGAGCPVEDIVGKLGLAMQDLWPSNGEATCPAPPARTPGRRIASTYDYQDETGVLRFQVVRWEPKRFSQRRPVGHGEWARTLSGGLFRRQANGVWQLMPDGETASGSDVRLEPVRPLLYRLPELLAADPTDPVLIPEGEKDVEALRALGLVATTNPMGAGKGKWRKDYAEWLRGRRVVVLPDNDAPGRAHAATVLASLQGVAEAAAVLALPDLPPKGDVSDWLAAGGTAERLAEMAEEALTAPQEKPARKTAWLADLVRAGAEVRWLWEGWIQTGVLTAIAAEGGTGKTRFCADLLRRIRHGLPWPDGQAMHLPRDSVALWVVSDNHHDEMVSLARAFGVEDAVAVNSWADDPYGGVTLDNEDDLRDLGARITEVKPVMVVVDTVGNATDRNLSRQEDAKAFYQPLQIIARRHGCAVLCLTHLNATGKFLGRRVLEKVRVAIRMEKPNPKDPRRCLSVPKTNSRVPESLGVTMGDTGNEYDDHPPTEPEPEAEGCTPAVKRGRPSKESDAACDWLRGLLQAGPQRVGITISDGEALGYTVGTLYRAARTIGAEEYETEGRKWWRLASEDEVVN